VFTDGKQFLFGGFRSVLQMKNLHFEIW